MKGDNILEKREQSLLRQELGTWAPHIETYHEMQSRRVEDLIVPGLEECAYEKVNVFVQKGLAEHKAVFMQVLRVVCAFQLYAERGKYLIVHYAFGEEDGRLHRKGVITVYSNPSLSNLSNLMAEASGTEKVNSSSIPNLGQAGGNDLQIFFCADRDVCLTEDAMKRYGGSIRRRSLWVFPEPDKVGWEFGTFSPAALSVEKEP